MEECPKPSHDFLKTPDLDSDLEDGLDERLGRHKSKLARAQERELKGIQAKVLKTTGPLVQLWAELDALRKEKEATISVKPLLKLVEQSLTLVGQSNIATLFARRTNILSAVLKDNKQATKKLQKYEGLLDTGGKLFGESFQKKIVKTATSSKSLLTLKGKDTKPFRRERPPRADRGGRPRRPAAPNPDPQTSRGQGVVLAGYFINCMCNPTA